MSNKKSLQIKDVISLADFASAEISYEKESGVRAVLNRPKDTPPVISQHQMWVGHKLFAVFELKLTAQLYFHFIFYSFLFRIYFYFYKKIVKVELNLAQL